MGGTSPNSDYNFFWKCCVFCVFCVVFMFPNVSENNLNEWPDEWKIHYPTQHRINLMWWSGIWDCLTSRIHKSVNWSKHTLSYKDKRQQLLTCNVSCCCCLSLHCDTVLDTPPPLTPFLRNQHGYESLRMTSSYYVSSSKQNINRNIFRDT